MIRYGTILIVYLHQILGKSDHSRLPQCFFVRKISISPTNCCERKKCCTAETILLQKLNQLLSSILIIGNNILNTSAKCSLYCNLIFLIHLNNVSNNTDNSRIVILLFHHTLNGITVAIVPLCNIPKCF